jgi:hypothetical protein
MCAATAVTLRDIQPKVLPRAVQETLPETLPVALRETLAVRLAVILLLAVALGICPSAGAAPANKVAKREFASAEVILRWINGYRSRPNPAKLPAAVHAMSDLGLFRDLDTSGVYIGFMAGVLQTNPDMAESLVAKMFPMPPEDQVAIVRAIAYSDLANWKELLLSFAERMPARQNLIDRFVYGKQPTIKQLDLDAGPGPLDVLWGQYFATGAYDPILRMVSILTWAKDTNNVERLTIGSLAKLSLATNASRDKDLLDLLKASMGHETTETRAILKEVIDAAETFEFSRVRKDAMASIDQLKAKGPADKRNLQWWGTAGQTALALGCVVAGVMGHAEIGIPCVIGGAVSGAALKVMAP